MTDWISTSAADAVAKYKELPKGTILQIEAVSPKIAYVCVCYNSVEVAENVERTLRFSSAEPVAVRCVATHKDG